MPEYITKEQAWEVVKIVARHGGVDSIINADKRLANMPAADVEEVVHARWIEDEYAYATCSHCGYEMEHPEEKTPYCPQCGARMEGEEQ